MTTDSVPHLLVFGPGYSARPIMAKAKAAGWTVSATYRRPDARPMLEDTDVVPVDFSDKAAFYRSAAALPPVSHILTSIAPGPEGDPVLALAEDWLAAQTGVRWIGYLSSTNVYGDHGGDWVDEDTPVAPSLDRGHRRVAAEASWTGLAEHIGAALHIFRLAGIYGPGRNAIRTLLDGRARRIVKPGQLFSRIHVADIAGAVWAAANAGLPSDIFNLADDLPAPPAEVIEEAARLLDLAPPPLEDWDTADMSPMARSFYLESKRVRNDRVKARLGYQLQVPDYRVGLAALLAGEG